MTTKKNKIFNSFSDLGWIKKDFNDTPRTSRNLPVNTSIVSQGVSHFYSKSDTGYKIKDQGSSNYSSKNELKEAVSPNYTVISSSIARNQPVIIGSLDNKIHRKKAGTNYNKVDLSEYFNEAPIKKHRIGKRVSDYFINESRRVDGAKSIASIILDSKVDFYSIPMKLEPKVVDKYPEIEMEIFRNGSKVDWKDDKQSSIFGNMGTMQLDKIRKVPGVEEKINFQKADWEIKMDNYISNKANDLENYLINAKKKLVSTIGNVVGDMTNSIIESYGNMGSVQLDKNAKVEGVNNAINFKRADWEIKMDNYIFGKIKSAGENIVLGIETCVNSISNSYGKFGIEQANKFTKMSQKQLGFKSNKKVKSEKVVDRYPEIVMDVENNNSNCIPNSKEKITDFYDNIRIVNA